MLGMNDNQLPTGYRREDGMGDEKKIKILLVDDEVKFLETIATRLELRNLEVMTATSGEESIAAAEKNLFDVAILDLKMPGLDGAQVLKQLKERHKYLEIIMLTGHATIDSAVACTKLGAFKFLRKPYDFEKLLGVISEAYEERLRKKFEHDALRIKEIQNVATRESPLGILRALSRMDDEQK
jgi:DNA-binding NtrC family response regulator